MNLIQLTKPGPETDFEFEYIKNVLFKNVLSNNNNPGSHSDRRLFIYSANKQLDIFPYDINDSDLFLHLSNENLNHQYYYLKPQNVIFRSYFNPLVNHNNVYAVPLGFQSGFYNYEQIHGSNDKYIWSFIGQMKTYREPMYDAFRDLDPHYSNLSENWNSNSITFEDLKNIYMQTAFALCPFGSVHPDTIRVMEVLEWGCIPVTVKFRNIDYYKLIYGNHPFIIANDWREAVRIVKNIFYNSELLKQKQTEVKEWYKIFKSNLTEDIERICNGERNIVSHQFAYQKNAKNNLVLKLKFFYHFKLKKRVIY